jgi:Protein of unknown function (DUF1580)
VAPVVAVTSPSGSLCATTDLPPTAHHALMININHEQVLPVNKVPAYLQSRGLGKRVSVGTVYRWMIAGVGGVRLETVRIGGQMVTSAEAIQRWVEAREEATHKIHPVPTPPAIQVRKQGEDEERRSGTCSRTGAWSRSPSAATRRES